MPKYLPLDVTFRITNTYPPNTHRSHYDHVDAEAKKDAKQYFWITLGFHFPKYEDGNHDDYILESEHWLMQLQSASIANTYWESL